MLEAAAAEAIECSIKVGAAEAAGGGDGDVRTEQAHYPTDQFVSAWEML